MIGLWIAAALVSAGLAALMVQRARRASVAAAGAENPALAVYRRQMAELDDLADRGLLAEGERRGVRAETGRRLLAAAGRADPPLRPSGRLPILIVAALTPLAAALAYLLIGAPGFSDQPFAKRLAIWQRAASVDPDELTPPQLAAVWRVIVAAHPRDPEPLHDLALAEMDSRQPTEAIQALHRALALAPGRADLWELLGVAQIIQSRGELTPDAVAAFRREAALDPAATIARFYLAQARIEAGDVAGGLADWKALAPSFPPGDPRRKLLDQQIAVVTRTGHLGGDVGGGGAGAPSGPQMGRQQIQGMVDGLAARLAAQPDDPDGWVRLVRAYAVLGETDMKTAALTGAQRRYAGHADILAALQAAAGTPASPAFAASAPSSGASGGDAR